MPHLKIAEASPYSPQQLFDLVADVARYPEFLPWCKAARIISRGEDAFLAELVIFFKGFREQYTSRVSVNSAEYRITAEMVEGPFHHLVNHWYLEPLPGGGTAVHLDLDFRFKSRILEGLIGGMFQRASEKMVSAFRARAAALYGAEKPS